MAYPLDADKETGIVRLEGRKLGQSTKIQGVAKLTIGALLENRHIRLNLLNQTLPKLPSANQSLSTEIKKILGEEADRYGVALLDISNPAKPLYAEYNPRIKSNPGSVGKLIVAISFFQMLADVYPNDIASRKRVLKETLITADRFILKDHHKVPFWTPAKKKFKRRPIKLKDTASLWTYLDWMLSASSNAAAAMIQREMMLIKHFGKDYPVAQSDIDDYFNNTPKRELSKTLQTIMQGSLTNNGIDVAQFRQGGFFTRTGKHKVPGTNSTMNSKELLTFLFLLEQGKIVDKFSSLEIKRLLYMTKKRIRYASSPALYKSAVYYKSGSLYSCRPKGCRHKYTGSAYNYMNSVAIIETVAGTSEIVYLVALTSNVLKKNSAVAHQSLATKIHEFIVDFHANKPSLKEKFVFNVIAKPQRARVKIMNIKPRFRSGMKLTEGHYLLKVTRRGYKSYKKWIDLSRNKTVLVDLVKK
jgi:hypothetical protein